MTQSNDRFPVSENAQTATQRERERRLYDAGAAFTAACEMGELGQS